MSIHYEGELQKAFQSVNTNTIASYFGEARVIFSVNAGPPERFFATTRDITSFFVFPFLGEGGKALSDNRLLHYSGVYRIFLQGQDIEKTAKNATRRS